MTLLQYLRCFDPSEPRDASGKWTEGMPTTTLRGEKLLPTSRDTTGKRVLADGRPLPAHIEKMRIPPAWTNVHVNLDSNGVLLAHGFDAKGHWRTC